ncbi:MAG: glycosyltransferase 87 family protein [Terriglobales bacterium]
MGISPIRLRLSALIALAVLLEAVFVYVVWHSAAMPLPRLLLWLTAAGIVYLIAVWMLVSRRAGVPLGRSAAWLIFAAALVFRLTLLPLTPAVSHQLWRFHWDGKIEHAGFNPYVYAPANHLFDPIRTPADASVPTPQRAAAHPPLAELLLHWDYNWFPGLRTGKILFVAADLLLILLLMRMLRGRGLRPEWALIYAWSPLAVFEVAGNGHLEPVAALLVLLGLGWCDRRARAAGVSIAAAATSLWYAVVLIPVVLVGAGKRWARSLRWGIGLAVVVSAPFWFASRRFVLGDIVRNVRAAGARPFNASLYVIARAWFGTHAGAILACALVIAVLVFVCRRRVEPLRAGFLVVSALLLVLPQVQPWFMLWLLPLMVFFPEAAWLYFSVAVLWAYAVGSSEAGVIAEYVPLYALLAWQAWRNRRQPAATTSAPNGGRVAQAQP